MMRKGYVIGAFFPLDDTSKQEAIDWVRSSGYTKDDVTIRVTKDRDGYVVIALRKLW